WSFAILSATSLTSEPVFSSIERSSGAGTRLASRSASASTGSDSIHELRCTTSSSERRIASEIRGWLCPIVEQIWPEVKSSTRFPSVVSTQEPSARATTKGAKSLAYRIRKRSRSSAIAPEYRRHDLGKSRRRRTMSDENKALVRRFYEEIDKG